MLNSINIPYLGIIKNNNHFVCIDVPCTIVAYECHWLIDVKIIMTKIIDSSTNLKLVAPLFGGMLVYILTEQKS